MGKRGTQHSSLSRWRKLGPLSVLAENERVMPEDTRGLTEMYWHKFDCYCAACQDPVAVKLKQLRAWTHHLPATRVASPAHELPRLPEHHLRDVERVAR